MNIDNEPWIEAIEVISNNEDYVKVRVTYTAAGARHHGVTEAVKRIDRVEFDPVEWKAVRDHYRRIN